MKLAQGGHAAKLRATTPTRRASGLLEQSVGRGAADKVVPEINVDWRRPGQRNR
jgi:hypothetical protein